MVRRSESSPTPISELKPFEGNVPYDPELPHGGKGREVIEALTTTPAHSEYTNLDRTTTRGDMTKGPEEELEKRPDRMANGQTGFPTNFPKGEPLKQYRD